MGTKRTSNKAVRCFFLVSLAIHALLLLCLGRSILARRVERRIEVDLRAIPSANPVRNIPQPYRRPRATPDASAVKAPIRSRIPMPVPAPVSPRMQERAIFPDAVERIHKPFHDGLAPVNGGLIGEIKRVGIPQVPTRIQTAYDTFDRTVAYRGIIRRHIERHKSFPPLAVKRGLEGRVGIRFLLRSNGQVEGIAVTKSSGIPILDDAAVSAVRGGAPFPPFPDGIPDDHMSIEVTLVFELMRGVS